jgi:hypothetical protein
MTLMHLVAAAIAASQTPLSPYLHRQGDAEVRTELAKGGPARLYTHRFNGRAPGFSTPGLTHCDPRSAVGTRARTLFRPLPEADWSEPMPFTHGQEIAVRFARSYNLTMFKARRAEILRICPEARKAD